MSAITVCLLVLGFLISMRTQMTGAMAQTFEHTGEMRSHVVQPHHSTLNTSLSIEGYGESSAEIISVRNTGGIPDTESQKAGCEAPPVKHGTVQTVNGSQDSESRNYTIGSRVEVTCEAGYRFHYIRSIRVQLICLTNGTWTDILFGGLPSCELIGGCPPPHVPYGTIAPKLDGYMPMDHAVIVCNDGYMLTPKYSKPVIVCGNDGTWTTDEVELPKCKAASDLMCQLPRSIENGGYKIHPESDISDITGFVRSGSRVAFYCNDGYQLSAGDESVIICDDGVWSSSAPLCQPRQRLNYCLSVPEVPHARHYEITGASLGDGSVAAGTKVVYICEANYRQQGSSTATCIDGEWSGRGPTCISDVSCNVPPPNVQHAEVTVYRRDGSNSVQDAVNAASTPNGASAYYFCHNGYRILDLNATTLLCSDGEWKGQMPECVKRTGCDVPMDIENGNWIIRSLYADFRFGVKVSYECENGYKAIGTTDIECLTPGYWSDYPPKCLAKDEYCSEPAPIHGGFFMCKPSQCDSFHMGTSLHYVCSKNYEMRPGDQTTQTCLPGGVWWPREPPTCLPVDFVVSSPYLTHLSTNTITVVVSSSCAVLGLLVLVMLIVALQRRWKAHSSSRLCTPSLPIGQPSMPGGSAPYVIPPRDENDRLALIAFADDIRGGTIQAPLPSYEEAIRSGAAHFPGFSRYIEGGSRTSSGRSSRSDHYRPLGGMRSPRDVPPAQVTVVGDHRRNSIVTTASNNLSVAAAFGSLDTVNATASDTTSTSVTVDTYDSMASNPSIVASQRAAAGSIESASIQGSLASEVAPLLDNRGTLSPDHRDTGGCDTLRSQTSRGTHSDTSSRIVEVPEEYKDE